MDFQRVFFLAISLVLSCFTLCNGQGVCTGVTPCNCKFQNGQYLHLDELARTDGFPRFVNATDKHEMSYSWNPCFNFTEGPCKEVAICGIQPSLPNDIYLPLGYQNTATFTTNTTDNSVTIMYKTQEKPVRTSYVALICTKGESNFKAIGQKEQLSTDFYFELRSPLACPQGVPTISSTVKPNSPSVNTALEASLAAVSVVALTLLVTLVVLVLKMKGKICKSDASYDQL